MNKHQMSKIIYKICSRELWEQATSDGIFRGAAIDLQDGFIHFSAAHQVHETARKHFHGQTDLVLISVETTLLGDHLKWEVSRGGDLFPHLYEPLKIDNASQVIPLENDANGNPLIPFSEDSTTGK